MKTPRRPDSRQTCSSSTSTPAKARLSSLIGDAIAGREIVIARTGRPAAKIVALKGAWRVPKDFDKPLPRSVLAAFGVEK